MCLIAFAWQAHPRWPLLMIANRDEFHARPSQPADFLADAPGVYGGVDLRAGGSWLLVSARRRMAAVTNVRVGVAAEVAPRSRGEMVRAFASSEASARDFIAGLAPVAHEYGRFNLLLWDGASLHCVGNHPRFHAQDVAPGVHALSNADLDAPWPKLLGAKASLSRWLHMQSDADGARLPDVEPLFATLADRAPAADAELPDTGVGVELERLLSPLFIAGETYGTRCSTVVFCDHGGIDVIERRFGADGVFEGERAAHLDRPPMPAPLR
jgi:uncharacterized protein with NRDE domain